MFLERPERLLQFHQESVYFVLKTSIPWTSGAPRYSVSDQVNYKTCKDVKSRELLQGSA